LGRDRKTVAEMKFLLSIVFLAIVHLGDAWFQSSDKWAKYDQGCAIRNHVWGPTPGVQTLWVDNCNNWGVTANHWTHGKGVQSYSHIQKIVQRQISQIKNMKCRFSVTVPNSGTYNTAFDIWDSKDGRNPNIEIMIWVNYSPSMKPISFDWMENPAKKGSWIPRPVFANQWIDGKQWNVYNGTNGAQKVISVVVQQPFTDGTVDVLAIMQHVKSKFSFVGDMWVNDVNFGWEIDYTEGKVLNFNMRNFALDWW